MEFNVRQLNEHRLFRIKLKKCVEQVFSNDGQTKVGKISKQWSGLVREAFTDADMFGINFPMDLDVKIKAVLLGACFLIVIFSTLIVAVS